MKLLLATLATLCAAIALTSCQSNDNTDLYSQNQSEDSAELAAYGGENTDLYGEGAYHSAYSPPPGPYPQSSDYVEVVSVVPDPYAGTEPVEIVSSEMPTPPAPPTPPTLASNTSAQYEVVSGDTLFSISRRHGTSVDALKQANALNSDLIRPGDVLAIP